MAEHYCETHKCQFYKHEKDGKVWYSHKVEGGGYCNEAKGGAQPEAPPTAPKPVFTPSKPETSGQERGMWWKEVGENFRAGLFKKDVLPGDQLWKLYVNQMLTSLDIKIEKK